MPATWPSCSKRVPSRRKVMRSDVRAFCPREPSAHSQKVSFSCWPGASSVLPSQGEQPTISARSSTSASFTRFSRMRVALCCAREASSQRSAPGRMQRCTSMVVGLVTYRAAPKNATAPSSATMARIAMTERRPRPGCASSDGRGPRGGRKAAPHPGQNLSPVSSFAPQCMQCVTGTSPWCRRWCRT